MVVKGGVCEVETRFICLKIDISGETRFICLKIEISGGSR
jgi:hypothetical protein